MNKKQDRMNSKLLLFLAVVSIVVSTVSLFTVMSAVDNVESGGVVDSGVAEGQVTLSVVAPPSHTSGGMMTGNVVLNVVQNPNKKVI